MVGDGQRVLQLFLGVDGELVRKWRDRRRAAARLEQAAADRRGYEAQDDFDKAGGVKKVLAEKAPEKDRTFLASGDYEVGYLSYNWGLNDQGPHGRSYSKVDLIFDRVFH